MKTPICIMIISFCLARLAYANSITSTIELNDGSVIEGALISLDNGVYTVDTESLGKVEIGASKVKRIASNNAEVNPSVENFPATAEAQDPGSEGSFGPEMRRMQEKISGDPEAMKTVAGMLFDPQFQEILKDPAIVSAVKAQDIKTLMQNEKFMGLMDNQSLLELQGRLKKQEEQND